METLEKPRFTSEVSEWIFRWNLFCEERWGKSLPVQNLVIPKKPGWARALIIMHPSAVSPAVSLDNYQKHYTVQKSIKASLEALFGKDRRNEEVYALWHRGYIEADEKYRGSSADDIRELKILDSKEKMVQTMRLVEYLEFAHFFKWETAKSHKKGLSLDVRGETIFPETTLPASRIMAKAFFKTDEKDYGLHVSLEKPESNNLIHSVREVGIIEIK